VPVNTYKKHLHLLRWALLRPPTSLRKRFHRSFIIHNLGWQAAIHLLATSC
jgi:hypothetical protein